ncbi:unnamed protein product, partial [Leptidea sinapis]
IITIIIFIIASPGIFCTYNYKYNRVQRAAPVTPRRPTLRPAAGARLSPARARRCTRPSRAEPPPISSEVRRQAAEVPRRHQKRDPSRRVGARRGDNPRNATDTRHVSCVT